MQPAQIPVLLIATKDGTVVAQNQPARRLMGDALQQVEHRAKPATSLEVMIKSGYVTQDHVIALVEAAGFKFEASIEINANPKDSANHPKGVWSLPPGLRMGDEDRDRYIAIGESDRMTLKFFKP